MACCSLRHSGLQQLCRAAATCSPACHGQGLAAASSSCAASSRSAAEANAALFSRILPAQACANRNFGRVSDAGTLGSTHGHNPVQPVQEPRIPDVKLLYLTIPPDAALTVAGTCSDMCSVLPALSVGLAGMQSHLPPELARDPFAPHLIHNVRVKLGAADIALEVLRSAINCGTAAVHQLELSTRPYPTLYERAKLTWPGQWLRFWAPVKTVTTEILDCITIAPSAEKQLLLRSRTYEFVQPRLESMLRAGVDFEQKLAGAISKVQ